MDENSPQRELTSTPSPKRARIDRAAMEVINWNPADNLHNTNGPTAAGQGHYAPHVISVYINGPHSELYEMCVSAEREEKPVAGETHELSAASSDTHFLPIYKQMASSLEDETPVGRGVRHQDDGNHGTPTQPSVIQAVTCSDICHASSQQADAAESDLMTSSGEFCLNLEGKSHLQIGENVFPVSDTSISSENTSFEEHNYALAAEIPAAATISQQPADGDNEADAFSVIDPIIWSENDKEVEWLLCNSDSTAGGELSMFDQVCNVETTHSICSEVRLLVDLSLKAEQLQDQGRTPQCEDETGNKTQEQADKGKSSLAGVDGVEEVCDTAGDELNPSSFDHMETSELEDSHKETTRVEEAAGTKESHPQDQTETDEREPQFEKRDCISYQRVDETQKSGNTFTFIDGKQEDELGGTFGEFTCLGEEQKQELEGGGEEWKEKQEAGEMRLDLEEEVKAKIRKESPSEDVGECLENRLSACNGEIPEQRLGCFADMSPLCTIPSTTDAVVPCESQNAFHSPRYYPSAFTPSGGVLRGFDTFEKIKISPDDDVAAGLSAIAILSSSLGLVNTHQDEGGHCVSNINDRTPGDEKERKENSGSHPGVIEEGLVFSDSRCNEVPNFILEKDANSKPAGDDSDPHLVSSAVPADCDCPSSDLITSFGFEMEEKFFRVLQELNLFFDISRNESRERRPSSSDSPECLEKDTSEVQHGSPALGSHDRTSTEKAVEDHSLVMCGLDPAVSLPVTRRDGEQEVPLNRNLDRETSMDTDEKNQESLEAEHKGRKWSPLFACRPPLEQPRDALPGLTRRLEPLKTCTRPIRVGLSKRAKIKRLHHLYPYK